MSLLVSVLSAFLVSMFSASTLPASTLPASTPAPTSPADQQIIVGFVTVNGDVAPPGIRVTVQNQDETTCGDFVTGEGATFQLILPTACSAADDVISFLLDTGDQSATQVTITEGQRSFSTTVDFQLSEAALQSLGISPSDGGTPDVVPVIPSSPLSGTDLYVVVGLTVVPATALLILMVFVVGRTNRERAHDDDSPETERAAANFRSQIEGMVLVMVVLAVILLGVTDKIGSDGLVSVLAAIVGYTVGRQVTRGSA